MSDATEVAKEIRRAQREAAVLWTRTRAEAKQTRFTDPGALRSVKYAVARVWGLVDWRDITAAIAEHAKDPYTRSPWFLDAWAQQAKSKRETAIALEIPIADKLAALRAARR